ncbi:MAG: YitT family protein, partial [Clostridiales bacterium]|nr:YitT family protein [Clostridiales bacterium]
MFAKLRNNNYCKYFFMTVTILLGSLICGISYNTFIIPHKMLSGGLSGIALIINYITGVKPGLMLFILNIPVFVLGHKFVDREFVLLSMLGTIAFSFFLDFFGFLQYKILIEDIMLSSIY